MICRLQLRLVYFASCFSGGVTPAACQLPSIKALAPAERKRSISDTKHNNTILTLHLLIIVTVFMYGQTVFEMSIAFDIFVFVLRLTL